MSRTGKKKIIAIRARAYRVANLLPENVDPQYATLQEVQDAEQRRDNERRRRAEERRSSSRSG